jgi:hypothetical protein
LGAVGAVTLVAVVLVLAAPAEATFPGRNGLLAVQPLQGQGIVLIKANGRGERLLCSTLLSVSFPGSNFFDAGASRGICTTRPVWSPDGRVLMTGYGFTHYLLYPDGSCLNCELGAGYGLGAAFTSNPALLTAVSMGGLAEFGIDGLFKKLLLSGVVFDAVWSSRGELALVQGGWIWVGRPGQVRRLARGSTPSWSPDGGQLVFEWHGWVMIGEVGRRSVRRLMQGAAPVWSPDGRWIAFFGKRHRLSVGAAGGGSVRRVGNVTGTKVDWQPIPAKPPAACPTPPGATMIGSGDQVLIVDSAPASAYQASEYGLDSWAAMSCQRATGREQPFASGSPLYGPTNVTQAMVAGPYAALAIYGVTSHYVASQASGVELFDLRTACRLDPTCGPSTPRRGGEGTDCPLASGTSCEIDQLVLGSDAVSAVHTTSVNNGCTCTVEQIQASDNTGVHTVDRITEPDGSPTALTNLTLSGDALTWTNNGNPRSAQLQP